MDVGQGAQRRAADSTERRGRAVAGLRVVSLGVGLILLALTAGLTVFVYNLVNTQEHRLLKERTNEVSLVLTTSVMTVSSDLSSLSSAAGRGGVAEFDAVATAQQTSATSATTTDALLEPSGGGFVVLASVGRGLGTGQLVTGTPAATLSAVRSTTLAIATPIFSSASSPRTIGFALRGPGTTVVYSQAVLGPIRAPSQAGSAPFSDLRVALYATTRVQASQVLVATTEHLPLKGYVTKVEVKAGATPWLLVVNAAQPLVGSVAASAPWIALGSGLLISILVSVLLESTARRRDTALDALNVEHRFAETLQRTLLPTMPKVSGLDIASRYVAGTDHQRVGGDWFDMFELGDGQVAVVIGDVMGHDVEAAAAMSQVRAAVRAYAAEGGDPAWVIQRLARLVEMFDEAGVVTVVYGILGASDEDGLRQFRWANAGHLPPLLRLPDGQVEQLGGVTSPLLGAPASWDRRIGESQVRAGSTLFLYTDGLVEVHGQNLDASIDHLQQLLSTTSASTAADICDAILREGRARTQRDDIALLAVHVVAVRDPIEPVPESSLKA